MKENQGTPRPHQIVEFDSARADSGRVPREKRFEVLHKRRILLTSMKRAIISDTS
jgi:hypothetical protein